MSANSHSTSFALSDRAANYGDGVFSTLHIDNGQTGLLELHLARLQDDAQRLSIDIDPAYLRNAISASAKDAGQGVLKVLISAGVGGRGYARDNEGQPHVVFSHHPLPAQYEVQKRTGLSLMCAETWLASQPRLAGIKHLNRLEQVLIKQELRDTGFDDALVCDQGNCVIEGSASNVFWYCNGMWFTPDISQSGVDGVMRRFVLNWLKERGNAVHIGRYNISQVLAAQQVLLTNALMQVMPVHQITYRGKSHHYDIAPVTSLWTEMKDDYAASFA